MLLVLAGAAETRLWLKQSLLNPAKTLVLGAILMGLLVRAILELPKNKMFRDLVVYKSRLKSQRAPEK